ncbi:hypothetical protein ETB97_005382 [Aspergillus alliaceus]|uniref:Carboxylesterase type B domain-containing protein n=1 Tax=Petromyces alliaceus TaxID=209559 RepID=A0A8H6E381_PETAA|nr:hypothetical protein ETB97_005382 [Aspergillus burnettii]
MKTYMFLVATAHGAAPAPTVTIASPAATIVGLAGEVEQFPDIPFAKPPVGNLHFKPPVPLTEPYGVYEATKNKNICSQFIANTTDANSLLPQFIATLINSPIFQKPVLAASKDCLCLNIHSAETKHNTQWQGWYFFASQQLNLRISGGSHSNLWPPNKTQALKSELFGLDM